jgi:hypothetical protein
MPRLLLVLDDDRARLRGFEEIASGLGDDWIVKGWRDAPTMLAEIDQYLDGAGLISLRSGRVVADYLGKRKPACPVIVHTTNTEEVWLPVAKRLVFAQLARRVNSSPTRIAGTSTFACFQRRLRSRSISTRRQECSSHRPLTAA